MDTVLSTNSSELAVCKFALSDDERKNLDALPLAQHEMYIYDRTCKTPRLVGFFSDQVLNGYAFSGSVLKTSAMTQDLRHILNRVNEMTNSDFNAILVNKYRNQNDYISDHADDEKTLGKNGVVAINVGQSRKLQIKRRPTKELVFEYVLQDGEMYWMKGNFQREFYHGIPKGTKDQWGERISLTFRKHSV